MRYLLYILQLNTLDFKLIRLRSQFVFYPFNVFQQYYLAKIDIKYDKT